MSNLHIENNKGTELAQQNPLNNQLSTLSELIQTCGQLEENDKVEEMAHLLASLPPHLFAEAAESRAEEMLLSKALIYFHTGNFDALYAVLESSHLSTPHHSKLQAMWWEAHYQETAKKHGRQLGPVDRYHVRKKYPPPATIWSGEVIIQTAEGKTRARLREHFLMDAYPSKETRRKIAAEVNLSPMQVRN